LLNYAYNSFSEVEKPIQELERLMLVVELAVLMFCMIGCGMTCHALGKQEGIETTIEHLVDHGMLELEDEK
tara:strand:- start:746 stop:958 length:213 start_codon:yes stop_codon:yes gene_type:complete